MHHIMFDIDGTLVDSYELDSECYIRAVREVTGIDINSDWSSYKHVTDSGILREILISNQLPNVLEIEKLVKKRFLERLDKLLVDMPLKEIPGASSFLSFLKARPDFVISIATGGWYESAQLKLKSAGINTSSIPIASSNDRIARIDIMKAAEIKATGDKQFPCTYFGDGFWDKKACEQLGYNFVLVGNRFDHRPCIRNFQHPSELLNYIGVQIGLNFQD